MAGCHVVYCAISGDDLPVIAEKMVSAMKKAGLRRIIFMGAVGIYDEIPADMDDEDNVRNNPDQIPNRKAWKTAVWITRYFVRGIYGTGIRMILH